MWSWKRIGKCAVKNMKRSGRKVDKAEKTFARHFLCIESDYSESKLGKV